jgi:hypothetical protein
VRGVFGERGQTEFAQLRQQRFRAADGIEHAHGGDVERIAERVSIRHRPEAAQREIFRR